MINELVPYRAELSDMVGLQPALPHMGRTGYDLAEEARASRLAHIHQPPAPQSLDRAAEQSPMAGGRAARNSPGPVAEGVEDPQVELSRFSVAASVESCDVYGAPAPMLISRYERNPPPEFVAGKPGQSYLRSSVMLLLLASVGVTRHTHHGISAECRFHLVNNDSYPESTQKHHGQVYKYKSRSQSPALSWSVCLCSMRYTSHKCSLRLPRCQIHMSVGMLKQLENPSSPRHHVCLCACAAREAVYKWWRTDNTPATRGAGEGPRLMGKPSVRFRKVVNTTTDDGQLVAVTAQQYCVLVMDVPDLEAAAKKQHEKDEKAANKASWWNRWRRQTGTHTDKDNTPEEESSEDVEAGRTGAFVPSSHYPPPPPPRHSTPSGTEKTVGM